MAQTIKDIPRTRVASLIKGRERALIAQTQPATAQTITALDGLRAIAALLVLCYHFFIQIDFYVGPDSQKIVALFNGLGHFCASGVQLFFILSGFLLFRPYAQALLEGKPLPSARKFYMRRALRILPSYWLALFIFCALNLGTFVPDRRAFDIWSHILLVHNLDITTYLSINAVFWSLAIEVQFYVLLPLLAWGLWRLCGQGRQLNRLWWVLPGLWLLSAVYSVVQVTLSQQGPEGGRYFTSLAVFGYLAVFASGGGVAWLYCWAQSDKRYDLTVERWAGRAGWAGLGLLLLYIGLDSVGWMPNNHNPVPNFWVFNQFWVTAGYCGIMIGVLLGRRRRTAWLERRWLVYIGLISYNLYIWHAEIVKDSLILAHSLNLPDWLTLSLGLTLGIAVSIGVATLLYRLVERPAMQLRRSTR